MKTTYFIEKENTKRRGETRRQLTNFSKNADEVEGWDAGHKNFLSFAV